MTRRLVQGAWHARRSAWLCSGLLLLAVCPAEAQVTSLVSIPSNGGEAVGGDASAPALNANGRIVTFASTAVNLVPGDTNAARDIFVHDRDTRVTTRVSVSSSGAQANGTSDAPTVSADGRWVAFASDASNLVPDDTNGVTDVFLHDRVTGATRRVSVAYGGVQARGRSSEPRISANGAFVAFTSAAPNLVGYDLNDRIDAFLHDIATGMTYKVSAQTSLSGSYGGDASCPWPYDDGRQVVFASTADDLVSRTWDTNGVQDVFLHDRLAMPIRGQIGDTYPLSVSLSPTWQIAQGGASFCPSPSDGPLVAFESDATNLVADDTNGARDIFVRDRRLWATHRISLGPGGAQSLPGAMGADSSAAEISQDGRFVAFQSNAVNLTDRRLDIAPTVYLHDIDTRVTTLISAAAPGAATAPCCTGSAPAISFDGRHVAFVSDAAELGWGNGSGHRAVYVRDLDVVGDGLPAAALRVTTTADAGPGSLRQALADANANGSAPVDVIAFAIPGPGPHVIALSSALPGILTPTIINGYTQPGAAPNTRAVGNDADLRIRIDGQQPGFAGLHVRSHDVTIRGLVITRFTSGIVVSGPVARVVIEGNFIGIDEAGTGPIVPGSRATQYGIRLVPLDGAFGAGPNHVRIGGTVPAARNVIGATEVGIGVVGQLGLVTPAEPDGSLIAGNYVGTDRHGTSAIPNGTGLQVDWVNGTTIGGGTVPAANVIAGNAGDGLVMFGELVEVKGNRIGVGADGTTPLGNGGDGVRLAASEGVNGAPVRGRVVGNVIAYNGRAGISAAGRTLISRNSIHDHLGGAGIVRVAHTTPPWSWSPPPAPEWMGGGPGGSGLRLRVRVEGAPRTHQTVEVFSSERCGLGEGRVLVATEDTMINSAGYTWFSVDVPATSAFITATITSPAADTSAFSTCLVPYLGEYSPVTIKGRVTLATGVGVPGVKILVGRRPSQTGLPYFASGITDLTGHYEIPNVKVEFGLFDGLVLTAVDADVHIPEYRYEILSIPVEARELTHDFTSPDTTLRSYFAEGATGAFFDTSLAFLNVHAEVADVTLQFYRAGGSVREHALQVPARSQRTLNVEDVPGMEQAEFATVVHASRALLVDRTMRLADGHGSHAEAQQAAPRTSWAFAEGTTRGGFNLFYLLLNPADAPATATVTYLLPAPAQPIVRQYRIEPGRRVTIWVNQEDPRLAGTDVAAIISCSGSGLVAERAQYLDAEGRTFGAGHAGAGSVFETIPGQREAPTYFAEGATGPWFDTFLLVANRSNYTQEAMVTYALPEGTSYGKQYQFPPMSRTTLWLDEEEIPGAPVARPLADTSIFTTFAGAGLYVERAMWWGGADGYLEGHVSQGARASGTSWGVAGGEVGGPRHTVTYLLVGNDSAAAGTIRVTLYFEDGSTAERTFTVAGGRRFNVDVGAEFAEAVGRRFGAIVDSVGDLPVPIVVERSVYEDADGVRWAAGTNVVATRLR